MKICPHCAEKIQNTAMKCKHCGERLHEISVKGETGKIVPKGKRISHNKIRHKIAWPVAILRYALFIPAVVIAVSLFHIVISIGLRLLSGLAFRHWVILIVVLGGLLAALGSLLVTGITYATHYILKIVPHRKAGGIIFTIIIIVLTIIQIVDCFTHPIWVEDTGNFLRVVFILLIIGMCVLLSILANSKDFENEIDL